VGVLELETINLKPGQQAVIKKQRAHLNDEQRGLFFEYLNYCINHGLKGLGHFTTDRLYEDIKAWARSTYPDKYKDGVSVSNTEMNNFEFDNFLKLVDNELMHEFFQIDTSGFWKEYEAMKAGGL
jgi:hypothetical protein